MPLTTVTAFDSTLHKTNTWLKAIMEELGWGDYQRAYRALRAVLHSLRDRLPMQEAVDFGAQLPMLVRGFYYEGWRPGQQAASGRNGASFLEAIAGDFRDEPDVDVQRVARAVFQVISEHVTPGEVGDVRQSLPKDIRALWPRMVDRPIGSG